MKKKRDRDLSGQTSIEKKRKFVIENYLDSSPAKKKHGLSLTLALIAAAAVGFSLRSKQPSTPNPAEIVFNASAGLQVQN